MVELAVMYLDEVVAVRLKESSVKTYCHAIGKHNVPALGCKPALSLDGEAVDVDLFDYH